MSVRLGPVLRMSLAVLLLVVIAWLIDLPDAFALLRQTHWPWVLACLLVVQLQVVLSAIRWQMTAIRLGQALSVPRAIREYYLATLANLSLPGGITGDAARVYRNRQEATMAVSAQAVMIERLAGQLALAVVTALGWLLWPVLMHRSAPEASGQLLLTAVGLLVVICLLAFLLSRLAASRIRRFIRSFGPAVKRVWLVDRQWLRQGVLSLLIVATYLAVFAGCAQALQQPLSNAAILSIVPLVLLSMVIPLSIGGWGIREAAAATFWPLAGLSPEAGVATSILYGLVSLIGSVPGALWAWTRSSQE